MRIKQGLIKVVIGDKKQSTFKWWRISRAQLDKVALRVSSEPNFYYAKVYEYVRLGKRKGYVKQQIAYIYWKNGVLTVVEN